MTADPEYMSDAHAKIVFERVLAELKSAVRSPPKLSRWFSFERRAQHFLRHEGVEGFRYVVTWTGWYKGWWVVLRIRLNRVKLMMLLMPMLRTM
eukprot:3169640-Amphidinium_carterae.1